MVINEEREKKMWRNEEEEEKWREESSNDNDSNDMVVMCIIVWKTNSRREVRSEASESNEKYIIQWKYENESSNEEEVVYM